MKPDNLLALWERHHGKLEPQDRERFLADQRVARLCTLDLAVLEPAVKQHRKLDDIIRAVEESPSPVRPGRSPLGERTRKSRQAGRIWDPPAEPGTTDPRYR